LIVVHHGTWLVLRSLDRQYLHKSNKGAVKHTIKSDTRGDTKDNTHNNINIPPNDKVPKLCCCLLGSATVLLFLFQWCDWSESALSEYCLHSTDTKNRCHQM